MKQRLLLMFLPVLFFTGQTFAGDIIVLKSQLSFEGKIKKVKHCNIHFFVQKNKYVIPLDSISYIGFEDAEDEIALSLLDSNSYAQNCAKGRFDAQYHGHEGGNIFLGFLIGPIGVIGAALGYPKPSRGKLTPVLSENPHLFTDEVYLKCYRKRQRGRAVGNAFLGWGLSILFLVVVSAG